MTDAPKDSPSPASVVRKEPPMKAVSDSVEEARKHAPLASTLPPPEVAPARQFVQLEAALAEAAAEINCAGTVAHRIRVMKRDHGERVARLEKENEELRARADDRDHWKITADAYAKFVMAAQDIAGSHDEIDVIVGRLVGDLTSAREALRLTREWMLRELGHLEGCGYITEYACARLRVALEAPAPVAPSEERTE